MTLNINPLHVLVPAWFVGLSLVGLARMIKHKRLQQMKPATVPARRRK